MSRSRTPLSLRRPHRKKGRPVCIALRGSPLPTSPTRSSPAPRPLPRRSLFPPTFPSKATTSAMAPKRSWGLTPEKKVELQSWLPRLRTGEMTVAHAAATLGCSRQLVTSAKDGSRGVARRGRRPALTPEVEQKIEDQILHWHSRGAPLLERHVCASVQEYVKHDVGEERKASVCKIFKDGRRGRDWMRGFLHRHPGIAKASSKSLEAVRAAATNPDSLARMLALLKLVREMKGVTAANLFNTDECGMSAKDLLSSRKKRPLAPAGSKSAHVVVPCVSEDAQFFNLLPIIAADGGQLPPTFIVQGTRGNPKRRRRVGQGEERWEFLNSVAPPNSLFLYRTPAGRDGATRTEYCIFLAERVFSHLRPSESKVLIIDGCRAHLGYEALAALARVNVEVFLLPANTTHATQQLDVTLFQPLKQVVKGRARGGHPQAGHCQQQFRQA